MATVALLMGGIGAIIALLIGSIIVGGVTDAIDCDTVMGEANKLNCENATSTAWVVIAILPIALFFTLFNIFGGLGDGGDDKPTTRNNYLYGSSKETKKQRQKRKQSEVDRQMEMYDDKQVHSFLTNWFRGKKEQ